ncbi:MAG: hypothetical protein HW421_4035 [Ignavibacteria bacterium]|nr:hypothetical protein [Ignavibacteria bacterium]
MKNISLILAALLLNVIALFSQNYFYEDYELTRISSNFSGAAFNDAAIIVYGDAGVILRSTNRGTSWGQINLNDSLNILEMVSNGKNFYGISNQNYLLRSTDDGLSWEIKDFGNSANFYRLFYYSFQLFALMDGKIWILNQNLEKIKEYSFITDSAYYDGTIIGSNLFYSSGKGKLGFINLDNEQKGTIDLKSLGICSECPVPIRLFSNKSNLIYFLLGNNLYQFDINYQTAKLAFLPLKLSNAPFFAMGDDLFQIYAVKNFTTNLDMLYFGKADKINNKFLSLNQAGNDRYVVGMAFTDLKFISQDTIIAVGKGKLIYMSFDGGVHWELKSLLNEFSRIFLFDNLNAKIIASCARFLYTTDGGVTWLSQKNYYPVYTINRPFQMPGAYASIRFFNDKNNGFFYGESFGQKIDTNYIYSNDGGETINLKKIKNLQHFTTEVEPLITKCFNIPIIVTQRKLPNTPFYILFDRLNEKMEFVNRSFMADTLFYCIFNIHDTLFAVGKDYKEKLPYKHKLYHSIDTAHTWIEDFSFETESDFMLQGFYSASKADNYIFLSWGYVKVIKKDTIFLNKKYIINTIGKNIKEIDNYESTDLIKVIKLNGKNNFILNEIYISAPPKIISTINPGQTPVVWENELFKRFTAPNLIYTEDRILDINGFLSDTLFAFVAYDSLFNNNYLFYARLKKPTSVPEELKTEIIPNIYIMQPSPVPARDIVHMKILWNQKFDVSKAEFRTYNLLGMSILGKEAFSLSKINNYSAMLSVNISGLHTGVYFIAIELGGETRTAVIIVG